MLTRARAAVLAFAGLSLAACSNVHPGAAAVVDGTTITMTSLDEAAEVYCIDRLAQAEQAGNTEPISNADVRRQAVLSLVTLEVARDLAEEQDLQVVASTYQIPDADRPAVAEAFPGVDVDTAVRVIEDSREVGAIATALGEAATGEQVSAENQAQVADAGQQVIAAALADRDVTFAPRFGLSPSGEPRADTGSISVAPVDLEATTAEELPNSQRCS